MTVAILIPLHNAENTVVESLRSVVSQTHKDWKLFIVLNNCSDSTEQKVKMFIDEHGLWNKASVLFQNEEKGIAATLNRGLIEILKLPEKYDYVARLDGDDMWAVSKLEKQLQFFNVNNDVTVLGTQMLVRVDGQPAYTTKNSLSHEDIVKDICNSNNPISHPSVMFKTKMLLKTGLYDDVIPYAEDFWMWMKCIRWYKMANLEEALVVYNLNKNANPLHSRMIGHVASLVVQHLVK